VTRSGIDAEVGAVPVLPLVPEVAGQRRDVADLTDFVGIEITETPDEVSAAARQSRIHWRRHRERGVVGGGDEPVVHDSEIAEPPAEIADVDPDPWNDLALHADRKLLVPRPVAPAGVSDRVDRRAWSGLSEQPVVDRAAEIAAARKVVQRQRAEVVEIAVGNKVAVAVRPRSIPQNGE